MDGDRSPVVSLLEQRGIASDRQVQQALHYAAESAEPLAEAKANIERLGVKMKKARADAFARLDGPVAQREILSYADPEYQRLGEELAKAVQAVTFITAMREWGERLVSIWQSEGANIRHMGGVR